DRCDLSALCGHRRLGLCHWRLWHDRTRLRQHRRGADSLGCWFAAWRQYPLPQIHTAADLESFLIVRTYDSPVWLYVLRLLGKHGWDGVWISSFCRKYLRDMPEDANGVCRLQH